MSKLPDQPDPPPVFPPIGPLTDKPKYDPKSAYFERMNSVQLRNHRERQSHQFADSIGGCSSNYRY